MVASYSNIAISWLVPVFPLLGFLITGLEK